MNWFLKRLSKLTSAVAGKRFIQWTCCHCGRIRTWLWDEGCISNSGIIMMECDKCGEMTNCHSDGKGNYSNG